MNKPDEGEVTKKREIGSTWCLSPAQPHHAFPLDFTSCDSQKKKKLLSLLQGGDG